MATSSISPFGGQSQSAFGASKPFGTPPTGFGASQGIGGGFGGSPSPSRGTRTATYRKTQEIDTSSTGSRSTIYFNSISCMPEYNTKSVEELRWEDYQDGVKGGGASPTSGASLFGQAPGSQSAASPFGAASSPSPFGQPASSSQWGAPSQSQPTLFGGTPTPASPFGGSAGASTPAFGGFGATSSPSPFGAASSSGMGFGASSGAAPGSGLFGAPASGVFGQSSPSPFGGQPASSAAFGGFKPSSTPSFGFPGSFGASSSSPAFGASPASQSGFASSGAGFGFGASSSSGSSLFGGASTPATGTSLFGGTGAKPPGGSFSFGGSQSTPSFGTTPPTTGGLFGQSQASTTPLFGSSGGGFSFGGSQSTPSFGAAPASTGGGLFGAAPSSSVSPGTGGFSFGGASTPSFGGPSPSSGGFFGRQASTPAFGGFSATPSSGAGGLFGTMHQSTPSFSFSSQPSSMAGALIPTQQISPASTSMASGTGAGSSPYGTLPAPPQVTPLPEYRVGLTQRMLGPPSAGPPRPVAFISPRSLTPHAGGKLRPRSRGSAGGAGSAARLSRSPAEFFAAAARGGVGPGMGLTPSPLEVSVPNKNIFIPRDDPKKLFIRDSLPSTESSGHVSPSPSRVSNGRVDGVEKGTTPATPGGGSTSKSTRVTGERRFSSAAKSGEKIRFTQTGSPGGFADTMNGPPVSKVNVDRISDAEVSALLPKLSKTDYYVEPSLTQLAAMAREDEASLQRVSSFVVGRDGIGSVKWLDPVDVRGIDLDSIIELSRGSIEVYLDDNEKPDVGFGLNRPAEITMLKVFKTDKASGKPIKDPEVVERFARKLKKVSAEQGARFISYDGETGAWKFEVEHFSRYGLVDSSDEEETVPIANSKDFHLGSDREKASPIQSQTDEDSEADEFSLLGIRRIARGLKPREQRTEAVTAGTGKLDDMVAFERSTGFDIAKDAQKASKENENSGPAMRFGENVDIKELHETLAIEADLAPEDLMKMRLGLHGVPQSELRLEASVDHLTNSGTGRSRDPSKPVPVLTSWTKRVDKGLEQPRWPSSKRFGCNLPSDLAKKQDASNEIEKDSVDPSTPAASLPSLPTKPMQLSPPGANIASPCPVLSPFFSRGHARSIPDAGAFLGSSFRVGWAPAGRICSSLRSKLHEQIFIRNKLNMAPRISAASLEISQLTECNMTAQLSRDLQDTLSCSGNPIGLRAQEVDKIRKKLQEQLQLHLENSVPDQSSNSFEAPRWQMNCTRFDGRLENLMQEYGDLYGRHAAAISKSEDHQDGNINDARTFAILKHQQATWELLRALFAAVPAEEEKRQLLDIETLQQRCSQRNHEDSILSNNQVVAEQDESRYPKMEEEGLDPPAVKRLIEMQRRAEISSWLQKQIERDTQCLSDRNFSSKSSFQKILRLLFSHQIISATALAVSQGNVRLATLITTAGNSTAVKQLLDSQIAVWKDASFDEYIDKDLLQIYSLLAGKVDEVIQDKGQAMQLDWKRAMGMYFWYAYPPSTSPRLFMEEFSGEISSGRVPLPLPVYFGDEFDDSKIRSKFEDVNDSSLALDVQYELMHLFCRKMSSLDSRDMDSEQSHDTEHPGTREIENIIDFVPSLKAASAMELTETELEKIVARVLSPASVTDDPMDYSFSWYLLSVLQSIGVLEYGPKEADSYYSRDDKVMNDEFLSNSKVVAQTTMGLVSQLEYLGGMTHWAVYVALHIPVDEKRYSVVKYLLSRYCPEWAGNEEIENFLSCDLKVPSSWLAEAKALWATISSNDVTIAAELADAGNWAAAHAVLCDYTAPSWVLAGGPGLSNLADALDEIEPHAAEIDELGGIGTWTFGGGLYRLYLKLKTAYESEYPLNGISSNEIKSRMSWEDRIESCKSLSGLLNQVTLSLKQPKTQRNYIAFQEISIPRSDPAVNITLCRAAFSLMSEDLAKWVLADAQTETLAPGVENALLVSQLQSARASRVAGAVQMGAVALASNLG